MTTTENPGCLRRLWRLAMGLFSTTVTVYALGALVLVVVSLFMSEDIGIVGIVKSFLHLVILPVVVLFPLSLLLRRWRLVLLLVPVLLAFALFYGVYLLPRSVAHAGGGELKLLTFNVQAPTNDADTVPIVEIIRAADADIVAIQELSYEAAAAFEDELLAAYPHQALYPEDDPRTGMGLLSRYLITSDDYWRYSEFQTTLGHQQAELDLDSGPITVFNTHPIPPYGFGHGFDAGPHNRALGQLIARAAEVEGPVLLLGDFNMTDQFSEYKTLTQTYADTFREVGAPGFGFTYPAGRRWLPPFLRLDYIFHDASFSGIEARVWPTPGSSDHHAVYARLTLPDA